MVGLVRDHPLQPHSSVVALQRWTAWPQAPHLALPGIPPNPHVAVIFILSTDGTSCRSLCLVHCLSWHPCVPCWTEAHGTWCSSSTQRHTASLGHCLPTIGAYGLPPPECGGGHDGREPTSQSGQRLIHAWHQWLVLSAWRPYPTSTSLPLPRPLPGRGWPVVLAWLPTPGITLPLDRSWVNPTWLLWMFPTGGWMSVESSKNLLMVVCNERKRIS